VAPGKTPGLFMEYWLLGYGSTCPPGNPLPGLTWKSQPKGSVNCFFNGPTTYVPPQTVGELQGLEMTASTTAGGQDQLTLATTSGILSAVGQDSVLNLNQYWNAAEFNVFGDCCKTQTNFSSPTTIVVTTSIDDGTTNAPTYGTSSFTAETNNLTLAPPACPIAAIGGALPAVEFTESIPAGATSQCACPAGFAWDPDSAACVCTPKTGAEACGTLQCAGNVPDGCGSTIACPANCPGGEVCNPIYGNGPCCTPPVPGQSLPNQCPPICPKCPPGDRCAVGVGEAYGYCVVNTLCEVGSHYCVNPATLKGECLPQAQPCPTRSTCTPNTVAEACGTLPCAGNVPNGCGGTIACPAKCPSGEVCNPGANACCTPKTTAEACGTLPCAGNVPNGCGRTLACPAKCPSGEVCNPGANACCTPPIPGKVLPNQCAAAPTPDDVCAGDKCPLECRPLGCFVFLPNGPNGTPECACKSNLRNP
jgi:hypothetical protein